MTSDETSIPDLPMVLQAIRKHFQKVGQYKLDIAPPPALDLEVLARPDREDHVVYALIHRNRLLYVGKAKKRAFKARLEYYGRAKPGWDENKGPTETGVRLRLSCVLMKEYLETDDSNPIEAWLFRPEPIQVLECLAAHIEEGVESALHPFAEWNQLGRPKTEAIREAAEKEHEELSARLRARGGGR